MKKIPFITILLFFNISFAQIITPGMGKSYTFSDLAADTSGSVVVSSDIANLYQDLTISQKDTLLLDAALQTLVINGNIVVTIHGSVVCEPRQNKLIVSGLAENDSAATFEWRFDEAQRSTFSKIIFENGQNILIDKTEVLIDSCEFRNFTSQVIKYMYCNPVIQGCYFHDNRLAAINSGANVTGAPFIKDNIFYHNVLDNVNQPQINLGPGSESDTVFIIDNVIDGCSSMSGGVAIADLMNVSRTNVVLRGNRIENNRYGYTQNGKNIYALLEDNMFIDNNLETNPMNGGSGVSIYGYDTTCAAKLRRNVISGNLWGVTAIYYHNVDMGTLDDFGYNSLYDNENGGTVYALYNNAYSPISAIGNCWGGNSAEFAEEVIYHYNDQDNLGLVTFEPIWCPENSVKDNPAFDLEIYPNPAGDICHIVSSEQVKCVRIVNSLGQTVRQAQPETHEYTFSSLKNMPRGIYFIVVETKNEIRVKKLELR